MPYIPHADRIIIQESITSTVNMETAGELNYALATVIDDYLSKHGLRYQALSDVAGALSLLDFEVKRRIAAPYEDRKLLQNGDVFSLPLLRGGR